MSDAETLVWLLEQFKQRELWAATISVGNITVKFGGLVKADEPDDPRDVEARIRDEVDQRFAAQYAAAGGGVPGMPD